MEDSKPTPQGEDAFLFHALSVPFHVSTLIVRLREPKIPFFIPDACILLALYPSRWEKFSMNCKRRRVRQ